VSVLGFKDKLKSFLDKRSRSLPRRVVAVDFDNRQLRIVQAETVLQKRGQSVRLLQMVGLPMPAGTDISDPRQVGRLLGKSLSDMGIAGEALVCCVPRGQAVLKPLMMPPGTKANEIAAMVQFQVAKELTFRPEEAVIDFTVEGPIDGGGQSSAPLAPNSQQLLDTGPHDNAGSQGNGGSQGTSAGPGAGEGIPVLVAAIRVSVVDYYRQIAAAARPGSAKAGSTKASGKNLYRLGLRPYANMGCYLACNPGAQGRCVALVSVYGDETEIDVIGSGKLTFSRSAVVQVPQSREDAKTQGPENCEADAAIDSIVTEVLRTLQSYQVLQGSGGSGEVGEIFVAGGTGIERQLAARLNQKMSLRCELFDPTVALGLTAARSAQPGQPSTDASSFISAIGLALGAPAGAEPPLDFINPKRHVPQADPKRRRRIAIAASVGAAFLVAVASGWAYLSSKQATIDKLAVTLNQLDKENKRVEALASRVKVISAWENSGKDWLDHWAYLSCLFPSAQEAYIKSLSTDTEQAAGVHKGSAKVDVLKFTVQGRNNDVMTELGERLTKAGYVFKAKDTNTGAPDAYGYYCTESVDLFIDPKVKIDLSNGKDVCRPDDDISAQLKGAPPPKLVAAPAPRTPDKPAPGPTTKPKRPKRTPPNAPGAGGSQ
jgi:Tfp pilus assembly PilM family ATPase